MAQQWTINKQNLEKRKYNIITPRITMIQKNKLIIGVTTLTF